MPKYVVSSTLTAPEWTNSTALQGDDLVEAVSKLKRDADGDVVVHGSVQLAQTPGNPRHRQAPLPDLITRN